MPTYIDIHVLQDVPPSCINRDDTGTPKSAVYGGVRRLRVSSQAWKRATREAFRMGVDASDLGTRTKRVVEAVGNVIGAKRPDLAEQVEELATQAFTAAKIKIENPSRKRDDDQADAAGESKYLLFLSARQIERLAEAAIAAADGGTLEKKAVQAIFKEDNSIDIALFGRMVADDTDLNVDAACQVAHAISTHAAETEFDFFTAVDDLKALSEDEGDSGAGMIGTVEFSSATLYRYATINLAMLEENLGDTEAAQRAVAVFVQGFIASMPTGKQNTFANRTLPGAVVVTVRRDQPVSLVGAFEKPVRATAVSGYLMHSVKNLVTYSRDLEEMYGATPAVVLRAGLGELGGELESLGGEAVTVAELPSRLREVLAGELSEEP